MKFQKLFLSFLSSILLILSFPKANIEFFAWAGFVPLFLAIKNQSKLKAFCFSYFAGAIFWLGTIYWLMHVTVVGMFILIFYLAFYFGIFGLLFAVYSPRSALSSLIFIPSLWVILEYLRSQIFTGFPWALLGYSQYLNLGLIQIADITGAWGLSFLVMMVNVAAYYLIQKEKKPFFVALLALAFTLTYGYYKIRPQGIIQRQNRFKVSLIQGNIPQHLKWDKRAQDYIMNKYLSLTEKAALSRPDLIIWPEAALPVIFDNDSFYLIRLKNFIQNIHTPILLGAVTEANELYYNSAILIPENLKPLQVYDKLHLVPFGEYVPLRKILGFLDTVVPIGDFTRGKEYTVFNIGAPKRAGVRFSVLICFEDLFPLLSRKFVKKGADFLINITNDGWFKESPASYQHAQAAVLRAVENRRPVLRCANTGITGFIDSYGRITHLIKNEKGKEIFIDGYRTQDVSLGRKDFSLYTKYGDLFIVFCFFGFLYGIAGYFKSHR